MLKSKIILIAGLLICLFILPWGEVSEGDCPGRRRRPPPSELDPATVGLPPPTVSRPPLSEGLQPRIQSIRSSSGSLAGIAEPWEVWWTLHREKYLNFKQPIEWVTIKQTPGGTTSRTEHPIYKELFNILVKSIEDKDFTLAWNAALALGRTGDANAVEPLRKACQESKQILVQNYALIGLGWLRDKSVVDILKAVALDKKEQDVARSHAVAALGYLNDPAIPAVLQEIINDKDARKYSDVIATAALSMGLCAANTADKSAITILGNLLNSEDKVDSKVRAYAALGLGRIGTEDALKELRKPLAGKDKNLRMSVALALGLVNDIKAKDDLLALLKDKDLSVRGLAAISLAQVVVKNRPTKQSSTIDPALAGRDALFKALKDTKSADSDGLIVLALGLIGQPVGSPADRGDDACKEEFRDILQDRRKRQLLKCAVIVAMGLLKDKESVPLLVDMFNKRPDDPIMSPYLIMALGLIGDERAIAAIQPVWEKLDKNVSAMAYTNMAVALSVLGKRKEVVAQLVKQTAKGQSDVLRQYALHTLGLLGDRESAKAFVDVYNSENSAVMRTYSVVGIGLMMEKPLLPMITEWTAGNYTEIATLIIDHLLPVPTW